MLMPLQNSSRIAIRPRAAARRSGRRAGLHGLGGMGMGQSNLVTPAQYNNMFGFARSLYTPTANTAAQVSSSPAASAPVYTASDERRLHPPRGSTSSTGEAGAYIPGMAPQAPPDNSPQSQAVYAEQLASEEQMNPGLVPSSLAASAPAAYSVMNLAPGATAYPVTYLPTTETTSTSWFTDPTQELINGVENWMLVAGAGILLFMFMGRRR